MEVKTVKELAEKMGKQRSSAQRKLNTKKVEASLLSKALGAKLKSTVKK